MFTYLLIGSLYALCEAYIAMNKFDHIVRNNINVRNLILLFLVTMIMWPVSFVFTLIIFMSETLYG